MADKPTAEETALWQKRLASQANNRAWALSEKRSRSADEDEELLQAANASAFFWKIVGTPKNTGHAALLLAHVYALIGLANPARHYLGRATGYFETAAVEPWETAFLHAITANVAHAAGDHETHRARLAQAVAVTRDLADAEDRAIVQKTLDIIPKLT